MTITPAAINFTADYETIELDLEFLTPMFGGGVDTTIPSKVDGEQILPEFAGLNEADVAAAIVEKSGCKPYDHHTPIRGTAIRGALRHWWRATTGAWCSSISEMRDQEESIFGGISGGIARPGKTSIFIDQTKLTHHPEQIYLPKIKSYFPVIKGKEGLAYGTFSMSQGVDTAGTLHRFLGSFSLFVSCSSHHKEDLKLALSAFVHFGGIGGRTTRGFGQIAERSVQGELYTIDEIMGRIREKGIPAIGDSVGAIQPDLYINVPDNSPSLDNLNSALGWLSKFRQGMNIARDTKEIKRADGRNTKLPARSHWPEPDSIRRLTKKHSHGHEPRHPLKRVFPRARFGLPIITKFKDDRRGDPQTTVLSPANRRQNQTIERMRSPLQISVHNGAYSYLVLSAPDARTFDLKLNFVVPSNSKNQSLPETVQAVVPADDFQNARQVYPVLFDDGLDSKRQYDPIISFLNYVAASTHTPKLR